jgi:hypothetical protein
MVLGSNNCFYPKQLKDEMGNGYWCCMMTFYPKRFLQTAGGSTTSKLPADLQPWDEMGNE